MSFPMNKQLYLILGFLVILAGLPVSIQANQSCDDSLTGDFYKKVVPTNLDRCLDEQPALINLTTSGGLTVLHLAAGNTQEPEILKILINAGANIEAKSSEGFTPLHIASAHNTNPTITKTFLDAGADIEAKAELGLTPLHSAAAYNTNNEIIELLLKAGAQINSKIILIGWTPLHAAAAYNGNPKIIVTLLENGADPGAPDAQGKIPLDLLSENNNLAYDKNIYERLSEGQ